VEKYSILELGSPGLRRRAGGAGASRAPMSLTRKFPVLYNPKDRKTRPQCGRREGERVCQPGLALRRRGRTPRCACSARNPCPPEGIATRKGSYGSRSLLGRRRPSSASVGRVHHQGHPCPDWIARLSLARGHAYVPAALRGGREAIEGHRQRTIRDRLHAGLRFCNAPVSDPRNAAGASHFGQRLIEAGRGASTPLA
jgi:hypothetical protein